MPSTLRKVPTSGGSRALPGVKNPRAKIVVRGNRGIKVVRSVTIRKPAEELYAFWRDASKLPQLLHHPVTVTGNSKKGESHWTVSVPTGQVEWDTLIINDEPGKLIAWRSREGGDVNNAGTVRFEQARSAVETKVTIAFEYEPPVGMAGAEAKRTRDAVASQVYEALLRFKALSEAWKPKDTGSSRTGRHQPQRAVR